MIWRRRQTSLVVAVVLVVSRALWTSLIRSSSPNRLVVAMGLRIHNRDIFSPNLRPTSGRAIPTDMPMATLMDTTALPRRAPQVVGREGNSSAWRFIHPIPPITGAERSRPLGQWGIWGELL